MRTKHAAMHAESDKKKNALRPTLPCVMHQKVIQRAMQY